MAPGADHFRIADIPGAVRNQVYDHVLAHTSHEVGGVLVGRLDGRTGRPRVTGAIAALEAIGERASVTFTHDAWETILERQEDEFPNTQIVGWYHSHPGFGIFLSEHDLFIHRNFFGDAHQFAYVVDPIERSEGVFGWHSGDLALFDQGMLDRSAGGGLPTPLAAAPAVARAGKLTVDLADLDDLPETSGRGLATAAAPVVAAAGLAINDADLARSASAVGAPPPSGPPLGGGPVRPAPRPSELPPNRHIGKLLGAGTAVVVVVAAAAFALAGGKSSKAHPQGATLGPSVALGLQQTKQLNADEADAERRMGQFASASYIPPTPAPTAVPKAPVVTAAPVQKVVPAVPVTRPKATCQTTNKGVSTC